MNISHLLFFLLEPLKPPCKVATLFTDCVMFDWDCCGAGYTRCVAGRMAAGCRSWGERSGFSQGSECKPCTHAVPVKHFAAGTDKANKQLQLCCSAPHHHWLETCRSDQLAPQTVFHLAPKEHQQRRQQQQQQHEQLCTSGRRLLVAAGPLRVKRVCMPGGSHSNTTGEKEDEGLHKGNTSKVSTHLC